MDATRHCSAGIISRYEVSTPGVRMTLGITLILSDTSEPQPDILMRLLPEYGGLAVTAFVCRLEERHGA